MKNSNGAVIYHSKKTTISVILLKMEGLLYKRGAIKFDSAEQRIEVAAGEYATESELIRDGLRALMARDRAVDRWLRQTVGPAYDALKADPMRAVSIDQVRATLAAEHKKPAVKAW